MSGTCPVCGDAFEWRVQITGSGSIPTPEPRACVDRVAGATQVYHHAESQEDAQ